MDPNATVDVVLDHIDCINELIGWRHIGIGTDWPTQATEDIIEATLGVIVDEIGFRPEDNISTTHTLRGFQDYRDMPNIARGLVARGYEDEQIRRYSRRELHAHFRSGVRLTPFPEEVSH